MEQRLVRPDLNMFRKRDYIKKYWYIVIIAIACPIANIFLLTHLFGESLSMPLGLLYTFLGLIPYIFMLIHYGILYEKVRKQKWAEFSRWEKEPEIREALKIDYINMEISFAVKNIKDNLETLKKYINTPEENYDLFILNNPLGTSYVIYEASDESIDNGLVIDVNKQNRMTFTRKNKED